MAIRSNKSLSQGITRSNTGDDYSQINFSYNTRCWKMSEISFPDLAGTWISHSTIRRIPYRNHQRAKMENSSSRENCSTRDDDLSSTSSSTESINRGVETRYI